MYKYFPKLKSAALSNDHFINQNEEQNVISDFESGMIIGVRRVGLSISRFPDLLAFSSQRTFDLECMKTMKRKHPVISNSADRNIF